MELGNISQEANYHRYRISVIEAWPDSAVKNAALAAARAALQRELNFTRAFLEARATTRPAQN